jgi:hypothetical protein
VPTVMCTSVWRARVCCAACPSPSLLLMRPCRLHD